MKVYTKTGDDGQTSLLSKQRVFKDHVRVHAYGTVDEANAAMGLARSLLKDKPWAAGILHPIQQELILLNADLATEGDSAYRISAAHVEKLEQIIDALEGRRIPQRYFVTPGDTTASAAVDMARTIVRRAERYVVRLGRSDSAPRNVALYLNRLSDLLFVLARCVEQDELVRAVTAGVLQALKGQGLLTKAKAALAAAEEKAAELGIPMVIAVVDDGGNLVAQHRMDGALLASISLALDKAYTAVALKMATDKAASIVLPGQPLYGLNTANGGRFIVFGGGLPIFEQEILVGGIGVSGGTADEDVVVAQAGLSVWQSV